MTLIAMAITDKPPILTADILVTSEDGEANVKLPNRPAPLSDEEVRHLRNKPLRFLQKIHVIQPNICICMAGGVYYMRVILEDFRNFCRWRSNDGNRVLTFQEVREFFSGYDQDVLSEIVCGIAVASNDISGFVFSPDIHKHIWQSGVSDDFGAVLAAGSGAKQYLEHINWHHQMDSSHEPGEFMYAKQVNFAFITKLLSKENLSLKSLEAYWGGFLETCYFKEGRFEKAGDVVFVISDAEADQEANLGLPIPRLFIYSQYIDNILYLTTVEATDFFLDQSEEYIEYVSFNFTKTLFKVEEIDARNAPDSLTQDSDLSFVCNNIAMGLNVRIGPKFIQPMSGYTEGGDVRVEFADVDYIRLIWPLHLQKSTERGLKEVFPLIKDAIEERNSSDTSQNPY